MTTNYPVPLRWALLLGAAATWACSDAPTVAQRENPEPSAQAAVHFWDDLASTRWNRRATTLFQTTSPAPPNGQAWASRTLTYLSIAQYRAALEAQSASNRSKRPSVTAAIARASVDILTRFYTQTPGYSPPSTIPAALENLLVADQSSPSWPGNANTDDALGNAIGHDVALAVWAQAQADGYTAAATLTNFAALQASRPIGAQYWVPSGAAVRSLWGVKPFFLDENDLVVLPPAPNLAGLQTDAAFVYTTMTVGSAEQLALQLAIANLWNKVPPNGPFTAGEWNLRTDSLVESHHSTEIEAARILAYANASAFDSQIECFATKYTYWVARPAQINNAIVAAFATPNHPSYPSGHSCISSAFGEYLSHAFPDTDSRDWLATKVDEAGWSRIYAGIHYVFDIEGGHKVGSRAAAAAIAGRLE